ncbi:MAG: hypothetical protein JST28_11395 [Acidobacteria bacterium]|nr:hypothetical protein [Acidobacteriota bacterium]
MLRRIALFLLIPAISAVPAVAGVIVYSPGNNASVGSPFKLSAFSNWCGSQSVVTTGYSLDSSTSTTVFKSQTIDTSVSASTGGHTLHVKAWGNAGGVCVTDVAINVTSVSSVIPANAASNSSLQTLGNWISTHDSGTPGSSSGWMNIVSSHSMSGAARQFATSYSNYGGQRYSVSFSDDAAAHNFALDLWVYLQSPSTGVQILELDLNQVLSNGQTILYGFQCNGWSSTWDFSTNTGSASSPNPHWVNTSAYCNPHSWGTNQWHHVQILYSRNDSGWVTYKSVALDGKVSNIGVTAFSAYSLGWGQTLTANVQVDPPSGSGGSHIFVDNMTVYHW